MAIINEGDFCAFGGWGVVVVYCFLFVFDFYKFIIICEVGVGLFSDKSIFVFER